MKKHIIIGIVFIVLFTCIGVLYTNNKDLKIQNTELRINESALLSYSDSLSRNNTVLNLSVEKLNYSKDSIINKLNSTRKELKIKDSQIENLQYLLSEASKKDTIVLKDTIFRDKDFQLDTLIGDEWLNTHLQLKYPNNVTVSSNYKSEFEIFLYKSKEYINPPKKCFLSRIFQKKEEVIKVEVVDNNPYAKIKNYTHIEKSEL